MSDTYKHQIQHYRKAFYRKHPRQYSERHTFSHDEALIYYQLYDGISGKHPNDFMYDIHHSDKVAEYKADEELKLFKLYGEIDVDAELAVERPKVLRTREANRGSRRQMTGGMPYYSYSMANFLYCKRVNGSMYINTWFRREASPMPIVGSCVHRWEKSIYLTSICRKCGLTRKLRINEK